MVRKRSGRRYRRCHECGVVRTASDFKAEGVRRPDLSAYFATERLARCPACGHLGPRWSFVEVEPPEGPGGPNRAQPGGNR